MCGTVHTRAKSLLWLMNPGTAVEDPYVIVDYLRVYELRTPFVVTWMVYDGLQSWESGGLVVLTEIFSCH